MEIFLRADISVRRREDETEVETEKREDLVMSGDRETLSLTMEVITLGGVTTPRSERDPEEKVFDLFIIIIIYYNLSLYFII